MTDTTQQQAQGTSHIRIGELLMQAEILSSDFIRDALERFEQRGLPIGKVLVTSGYLTESELRQALEVQSLVNDGHLPLELGVTVLRVAHKEHISLNDAFQRSGLVQPEDQETNRLGQLLVAAGIVTDRDLEEALQINIRTGLPLGHVFCFHGYVSQALFVHGAASPGVDQAQCDRQTGSSCRTECCSKTRTHTRAFGHQCRLPKIADETSAQARRDAGLRLVFL